ncbi:cytochrome P450, partial [Auricularia subglabra TFB-10046 SS5]
KRLPLPPGPRRLPLFGNALQMPGTSDHGWLKYAEWSKRYSDVMYLEVLGQPILVIGSAQAATDLLARPAATYSDRPLLTMAELYAAAEDGFAIMPYGDRYRHARRMSGRSLNSRAVEQYLPLQLETTRKFLKKLQSSPERFVEHIRWATGNVILKISYGYDVKDEEDALVKLAEVAVDNFSAATAPGWVVDSLPALQYIPRWFPGASFLQKAQVWRDESTRMLQVPFNMSGGSNHSSSPVSQSMTATLLSDEDGNPVSSEVESLVMGVVGSLYGGEQHRPTVSAMLSFFLAMSLHPEVQQAAKKELDRIIGTGRLPTVDDRPRLPYIEAIVKEVQRWNPVTPLGVPRRCMAEDIYRGCRIPEGSVVFANIWSVQTHIFHDEKNYPNSFAFDPERYLGADGGEINRDSREFAFGFGRRECPGRFVADTSIWLMIASILATFDISKARDKDGREIMPEVEYMAGIISHPLPFKCNITPRPQTARWII